MSVIAKKSLPFPEVIKRIHSENSSVGRGLSIQWSTGETTEVTADLLRKNCPCATCKEATGKINHAAPLSNPISAPKLGKSLLKVISHTSTESLDLREVWPIGNYALGVRWGDGHDSGIFTYALLHQLAKGEGDD